jgi:hypothetical protein
VAADRRVKSRRRRPPADHVPPIGLINRPFGQHRGLVPGLLRNSQPLRSSAMSALAM